MIVEVEIEDICYFTRENFFSIITKLVQLTVYIQFVTLFI